MSTGPAVGNAERIVLTSLPPDRARADAIRLRCRSDLARRAGRARRADIDPAPWTRLLVPTLLGAFAAFYAFAFVSTLLRLDRWLGL